ncbi:MAG TPA: ATP-binding cassette domain-containing protein [Candidatus Sumerlaeota bacterium]|nr:ATP-binding cassette domain-containing protein [Candidatus Sumerlaeota bacterium]HPS01430.1 ATP-binding cassette domain-containing protein [Candidatus Sumerlaeota bacterium]
MNDIRPSEPLIQFRSVRKAFGDQTVLDGVDLTIEQGVVTTIIGRSGVGKSVLLKHVVGLLRPDGGEILYRGDNLLTLSRSVRRSLKSKISYMFQNMALFDSMTVFENIALPLEEKTRLSKGEIRKRVFERIVQLDLGDFPDKYPAQLSGGMRKRVALARALITGPEIILFDEPTTGLDPIRKNAVFNMIARYQREFGFTAVVVSHDIPDVFQISQKVAMLEEGRIIFDGTREEVLSSRNPLVRQFIEGQENPETTLVSNIPEEDAK